MINFKGLFIVRPIDIELCIDIGTVSTDTLSLHLCVQFLSAEYTINLVLGTA